MCPRCEGKPCRTRWFALRQAGITCDSVGVDPSSVSPARVTMMTGQAREVQGGGTWGSREAVAEWRHGAAARLQAFGPATEMMLDLAGVAEGSRVLDVGAGAGDSAVVAAERVGSSGRVLATD